MDKTAERVHNQTIDFVNKAYEELSTIANWRKDLRYFNKDYNDASIDENISNMFILLDDIYNSCIQKKTNKIPNNRRTLFPDIEIPEVEVHTPSPRTPKKKSNNVKKPRAPKKKKNNNNIKVEITDDNEQDVLESIMYSSDGESCKYQSNNEYLSDSESCKYISKYESESSDSESDLELTDFSDSEFEEITN